MAQTQHAASGGGNGFMVTQRLIVQLPITEDDPDGGVIALEPGWYEPGDVDPRALENPILKGMAASDDAAAAHKAQADIAKTVADAQAKGAEAVQKAAAEATKAQYAALEAWNGKAQAAADEGKPFAEPCPDQGNVIAKALTATAPQYVSAGGMQSKIMDVAPEGAPRGAGMTTPHPSRPQVQRPEPRPA